jgi:hypothetical protein
MALNPAALASAMASAVGVTDAAAQASYLALATAIITHITANAVVLTTDTVPALGLISPGGLSPAPVTGIASGTGTGTVT